VPNRAQRRDSQAQHRVSQAGRSAGQPRHSAAREGCSGRRNQRADSGQRRPGDDGRCWAGRQRVKISRAVNYRRDRLFFLIACGRAVSAGPVHQFKWLCPATPVVVRPALAVCTGQNWNEIDRDAMP